MDYFVVKCIYRPIISINIHKAKRLYGIYGTIYRDTVLGSIYGGFLKWGYPQIIHL